MKQSENSIKQRIITHCDSCGDALYDGDTAYKLRCLVYCPACIYSALIVCRPPDDLPNRIPRFSAESITIADIPHKKICVKANEITRKTIANSKIQKG